MIHVLWYAAYMTLFIYFNNKPTDCLQDRKEKHTEVQHLQDNIRLYAVKNVENINACN